ncbi:MAG: DUF2795 domain-containing protein [Chloroflexi bacterium]|nr:DUF2795 domain-containing protein [Chloroflexota bacterium]
MAMERYHDPEAEEADVKRHDPGVTTQWGASHLAEYLEGVPFPQERHGLWHYASQRGAPEAVLRLIRELPDTRYDNLRQVLRKATRVTD